LVVNKSASNVYCRLFFAQKSPLNNKRLSVFTAVLYAQKAKPDILPSERKGNATLVKQVILV
jgi:hypothetical protein